MPNPVNKKLNDKVVKQMLKGGASQADVARQFEVAPSAVHRLVKRWELHDGLPEYQEKKANILESKQAMIVESITEDVINEANLQQRATAIGILEDKIRLERGQAVTITDVNIRALLATIPVVPVDNS